ncbi:MAG: cell division protein ZapA [Pseudomonadota bacterium]|nr:cell division protein ZapA [Pseudomonadota bacterium]
MAQVEVRINGRNYQVACDDGQEGHLLQLGEYIDMRVQELVSTVGQVGDSRLLVMTSLLVADELAETHANLEKTSTRVELAASANELEAKLAGIVDNVAARIEALTKGLSDARSV